MIMPEQLVPFHCVCSRFYQWYQWSTNIVQSSTNGTIGNTIGTNGNANGTIGSTNGTIVTNGKPMVPLVSQWYHRLPMVPLVKLPMVPLGEPRTEPLLSQLNWQILEERRSVARLCLFYKIINDLMAVPLPDYIQPIHRISRYCHSMTFRQIHTGKDRFKYSFFPQAVVQWNVLPANVVVSPSLEVFKAAVGELQHSKS